jgi:arginyl-tRNA synthetase
MMFSFLFRGFPMNSLTTTIQVHMEHILADLGAPNVPILMAACPKPEMGDIAIGCALKAASVLKQSPMSIAHVIAERILQCSSVDTAVVAAPGYVNIAFTNDALSSALCTLANDPHHGVDKTKTPERIILDFGGPNIKPMHVGHMRSLFIGESLRRLLLEVGHEVISDIHLGDWGMPAGMILCELQHKMPELPWFTNKDYMGLKSPISPDHIKDLYPTASAACKADPDRMAEARAMTADLQAGSPGPLALWKLIVQDAKQVILALCGRLGAHFNLELGESDAQPEIPSMLANLKTSGVARRDQGALIIDVAQPNDKHEVPPFVLEKGDGASLYSTTDLATLAVRVRDMNAQRVLYVVDARQSLHFLQLIRAAALSGIGGGCALEHIGFGTVNGTDGKPLKTRDGGVMPLQDLLDTIVEAARTRLLDGGRFSTQDPHALNEAAETIGLAAMRISDLTSSRLSSYTLDVERSLSFEGKTGPHLLYALVRLRSVLAKAEFVATEIAPDPRHHAERTLALACLSFGDAIDHAVESRAPHELVAWTFGLTAAIGRFYTECPVNSEPDPDLRESRLALCALVESLLSRSLYLLGCQVPSAM